jgi:myo-inositol-1(or 4)-monophosphatase
VSGGDTGGMLEVLHQVVSAVRRRLDDLDDWGPASGHAGQYRHDVVADEVAVGILTGEGFGVLSEESGLHHPERPVLVVVDPVDGSTNASRRLPWWATSVCALDADGPLVAVVGDQASGTRYQAVRGAGASCDGLPMAPARCRRLDEALVAFSGFPGRYLGWSQFRAIGAAALDLCAVAAGKLDAFAAGGRHRLSPWDYLGGLLICQEAGAVVGERSGLEMVVRAPDARRQPVAAATPELLRSLLDALGDGA